MTYAILYYAGDVIAVLLVMGGLAAWRAYKRVRDSEAFLRSHNRELLEQISSKECRYCTLGDYELSDSVIGCLIALEIERRFGRDRIGSLAAHAIELERAMPKPCPLCPDSRQCDDCSPEEKRAAGVI